MLIHFHDADSASQYLPLVRSAFPEAEDPAAELTAVDWLGRQYVQIGDVIYCADLGYGDFDALTDRTSWQAAVSESPRDVLDGELYDQFEAANGSLPAGLAVTDCVEYTVPIYLGGEDVMVNMAVIDLDAHWTLGSQLLAKVRDLPEGTQIGDLTIDPSA
jgi:hypothetical protein